MEGRIPYLFKGRVKPSKRLTSFIKAMLQKHPADRASVAELLKHPFLTSKPISKNSIVKFIEQLCATRTLGR